MTLAIPTIHLNGTSQKELLEQVCEAGHALREAERKLAQACPNGRDYYPQGPEATQKALRDHTARMDLVRGVAIQLEQIAVAISDGGHKRGE